MPKKNPAYRQRTHIEPLNEFFDLKSLRENPVLRGHSSSQEAAKKKMDAQINEARVKGMKERARWWRAIDRHMMAGLLVNARFARRKLAPTRARKKKTTR